MLPATMVPKAIAGPVGGTVPACRLIVPADADAVPVKAVAAGVTTAPLLFTFNDAVNVPAELDVKVTVIVQCAPTARVAMQLLVWVKSLWLVPLIDTLGVFMVAVPVFVKVAVCCWLPVVKALKFNVGVSDASSVAPGLSPIKLAWTAAAIGVTTGDATPTR
jgi:hypothetical protein